MAKSEPGKAGAGEAVTVAQVKAAKPGKLGVGGGLFLLTKDTGAQLWRMKYRHAGREKLLSFGSFPEVSLAKARAERDKARALLRNGTDPADAKLARKNAGKRTADAAFPTVAAAWLEWKRQEWAPETHRKAEYVVSAYLTPTLRRQSVTTLTTQTAADALDGIPPSLAVKARQHLGGIVTFAIRKGLRDDGRLLALRGAVPKVDKGHIPAATDLADVRAVVKAIAGYPVPVTRAALSVAMLTAQRPGMVAAMEWADVDLDAGEWSLSADKMKTRHAHLVPLSAQAVEHLRAMLAFTGGRQYVFTALARQKTPHLHRDALSAALRRMGFQGTHATHGFRGMLRTVARERLRMDADVLEAQLAHAKKGDVQKAYDRTQFIEERRELVQKWADYLDTLACDDGKVTPIRKREAA